MNNDNDSRPDTMAHIERVQSLIQTAINNLSCRAVMHDLSKLEEPEKSAFDRLKALSLSSMAYGSDEYRECLRKEKPNIQHHYECNSHHPEYYGAAGINGMSLFDVLEMLLDWKAATERMKDGGDIWKSIEINQARFHIDPQLTAILANTARELGWPRKEATP